jgi:hypothetical protein
MREYRLWVSGSIEKQLARLTCHELPWLTRLVIAYEGSRTVSPEALIAAAPNLVELYLIGDRVFERFDHPTLRRVYTTAAPPATRAETIAIGEVADLDRHPALPNWRWRKILMTISRTPDCNVLYARRELAEWPDSVPALLVRLASARLVELDGPIVELSLLGRRVLDWLTTPPPTPMPIPTLDPRASLALARARSADEEPTGWGVGQVDQHHALLAACLDGMPLDRIERAALAHYLATLRTMVAGQQERLVYDDLGALATVFRMVVAVHALGDRGLLTFDAIGTPAQWRLMVQLAGMLEGFADERAGLWLCIGYGQPPVL